MGIQCGNFRDVVWCIWLKLYWDKVCIYVAVGCPLSSTETTLQLVWRDSSPKWILEGFSSFKPQQCQSGESWGMAALFFHALACRVQTLVSSLHEFALANACSKIDQVCPDNMVNNVYLRIFSL